MFSLDFPEKQNVSRLFPMFPQPLRLGAFELRTFEGQNLWDTEALKRCCGYHIAEPFLSTLETLNPTQPDLLGCLKRKRGSE